MNFSIPSSNEKAPSNECVHQLIGCPIECGPKSPVYRIVAVSIEQIWQFLQCTNFPRNTTEHARWHAQWTQNKNVKHRQNKTIVVATCTGNTGRAIELAKKIYVVNYLHRFHMGSLSITPPACDVWVLSGGDQLIWCLLILLPPRYLSDYME